MRDSPRPVSESYWVEPGRFLAGEYPASDNEELTRKRLDRLIEAGFDTFIDLTQPGENKQYVEILQEQAHAYEVEIKYTQFPIGDFGLPTPPQMNALLDAIDTSLQAGHKIYLHCWAGIGRTGTTVGCYLIRHGRTGAEALDQLAAWWRNVPKSAYHSHSPETRQQRDFVHRWAEHDRERSEAA